MKPKLEYLKKNFDEIAILGVITKITLGKFSKLSIDDEPVIQAKLPRPIRKSDKINTRFKIKLDI